MVVDCEFVAGGRCCEVKADEADIVMRTAWISSGNDHTNMTAPLPVCSAKLSMFGPG